MWLEIASLSRFLFLLKVIRAGVTRPFPKAFFVQSQSGRITIIFTTHDSIVFVNFRIIAPPEDLQKQLREHGPEPAEHPSGKNPLSGSRVNANINPSTLALVFPRKSCTDVSLLPGPGSLYLRFNI